MKSWPGVRANHRIKPEHVALRIVDQSSAGCTTEGMGVSSPRVFMDPRTGVLNALSSGGTHGKDGMEKATDSDQCHDITVYSAIGLAAGACSGNGIVLDIKDPVHPKRLDAVNDPNYAYWHSASFSNDGTKVVFTDEWEADWCALPSHDEWGATRCFV